MRIRSLKLKALLNKSREAAILAVDVYNRPSTQFRSYGYIVLMVIAWTSLFHAIFEKRNTKYFHKKKNSKEYEYIDGEIKTWELSECVAKFYGKDTSPVKENLKFFIGIRNKIEHRFLPALDLEIIGECQALLVNYEKLLVEYFGNEYSLSTSLAIPLQLLTVNPVWRDKILKELQSEEYSVIKNFINVFRAALDNTISNAPEFSFRVFLVPQPGNHESSSDLSIEFVKYDPSNPEEMRKYQQLVAFIKEKRVQVAVVNPGKLKPGDVSRRVASALNIKFSPSSHHVRCWKHYDIRPSRDSKQPERTNTNFCQYDAAHNDYVYTEEWVDFLVSELSNPEKREMILERHLQS